MSDNNDDTEAQDTPRNPTLPPPPHTAEPSADVALDGPPMAPRVQVLSPVEHVRFGGAAGVRVQQLGAATVNRVQPGADVFDAFVRVRRDTLVQVRSALDASDSLDELRETVGELLASTFELLR